MTVFQRAAGAGLIAIGSFAPGAVPAASAQTASAPAAQPAERADAFASENPWRVEVSAWIWLMGVEGDVGVRGTVVDASASFADIIDASDSVLAFSGRVEVGYGRIAGFIDGLYADLGVEDVSGPLGLADIDVEFEQTIVDFGAMFRLGDWEPAGDASASSRNITLDLYGGGRYTGIDVHIEPSNAADRRGDESWVDPIFGAKLVVPFAEQWHFGINGDIGGFGVASDFTWSATALIGYDFHCFDVPASLLLGYRVVGWDYTDGEGNEEVTWDLVQHGLLLGFSLRF